MSIFNETGTHHHFFAVGKKVVLGDVARPFPFPCINDADIGTSTDEN